MKKLLLAVVVVIGVVLAVQFLMGGGKPKFYWWTPHAGSPTHVPWHTQVESTYNTLYGENLELIKVDYSTPDYKTAFETAMAGDYPPDVWHSWGGGILKDYVDVGKVADLTDLLNEDWALRLLPPENRDRLLWNSTWNNRHYGLPYSIGAIQIYINRSLFDAAGVGVPEVGENETWTWSEFIDAIRTFNAFTDEAHPNGIYPIVVAGAERWQLSFYYMYLVDRIGGSDYFAKTLNREPGYSFTDEVFIQAGVKCRELVTEDAFQPGFIVAGYDKADYSFIIENMAAMYLQGSWMVSTLRYNTQQLGLPEFPLDIIRFPTVPGGEGDSSALLGSVQDYLCVSEKSEHKEEAFQLLRLHGTDDVINDFLESVGDILVFDSRVGGGFEVPAGTYDPVIEKQIDELNKASHLQMPWDQYSPSAFAVEHLIQMNRLFKPAGYSEPAVVAAQHESIAQQLQQEGKLPITFG